MADQKFGRNSRAPSNAMQVRRTERNKRINGERAHARKIQQPHGGQKSADMYGHPPRLNAAEKFVQMCLNLWHSRSIRAQKEEA